MRVICKISGIEFFSSPHFKQEQTVVDLHPIFRLSRKELLNKAKKYGHGDFNHEEEKLIFLALLNATDAVEWEMPATPDISIVSKNLEQVFKLVSWYDTVGGDHLKLPKLRVGIYNCYLDNIAIFISTWYEVRKEWMSYSSRRLLAKVLEDREAVLERLIHSPRATEDYSKRLASWAMDAGKVPLDRKEEWTKIFCTSPDTKALSLDLDELLDLQDHMEKELYNVTAPGHGSGSIFSAKVLEHVHKLVKIREGGFLGLLGGKVGGPQGTYELYLEEEDFSSDEAIESMKDKLSSEIQKYAILAPGTDEPRKEDYPGKLADWIRAKASWALGNSARGKLEKLKSLSSRA